MFKITTVGVKFYAVCEARARLTPRPAVSPGLARLLRSFLCMLAAFTLARRGPLPTLGVLVVLGLGLGLESQALAAQKERRAASPDALPASMVLTNLRSPTGRTVYLLMRPKGPWVKEIAQRAEKTAQAVDATAQVRQAGDLWIVMMAHKNRAIGVHRLATDLRVSTEAPASLAAALLAGVRLHDDQSDADLDEEILLQSKNVMRDREQVAPAMVTLAQGAAARMLLYRYVTGDPLGAALFGKRALPFLEGHPDARLLREIVEAAAATLDPAPREVHIAGPPAPDPRVALWEPSFSSADRRAEAARAWMAAPWPKPLPPRDEPPKIVRQKGGRKTAATTRLASHPEEQKAALQTKADAKREDKPAAPAVDPKLTKELKPDGTIDGKPDTKIDGKPDAKPDAKIDAKPDAKPDAKIDGNPGTKGRASGKPAAAPPDQEDAPETGDYAPLPGLPKLSHERPGTGKGKQKKKDEPKKAESEAPRDTPEKGAGEADPPAAAVPEQNDLNQEDNAP